MSKHSKDRSEGCRTDSESKFLQQKNFSRLAPRRLIGARQTPIPLESNAADSGPLERPTPHIAKHRERSVSVRDLHRPPRATSMRQL
jgi:hypothetical protein